ncbi:sensor histidine kinase [Janthinobacterium sp. BJB1]|uniref:sensor histidine kinase n=1 Tax=Janthinobacterium sp. GW458P TaxID=1981504 RepID=UPI000A31EA54|nr:sensor histidine kinase [Janthinobacterium sp. GW458P]MBE3023131.1 sensor histidine kinase N-terminal domain-containing protein [Janthinobacterium sp. GW458P]PHV16279.1 sensor histidine kinase [Janthinobacterium sp. BJB303]PJC95933.1 sensor histidine kinase [Janthinobacterium sp. BJB1]
MSVSRLPLAERLRRYSAQGRPLGSLRSQLLRWLLIPLVMLVLLDAFFVYRNALDAADMAYDRSLLASTRALAERVSIVGGKVVAEVPYVALDSFETDTLGRIYYKVTGINGELVSGYGDLPPVPKNVPRSQNYPALVRFYHADYHGKPIRIAALLQPVYDDSMRGIALIQVAETLDARRGLSNQILFDTLSWQAAMILVMGALVWFAVRLVLQPLMRLKTEVETRTLSDLSDVDPALVHKEMRPLVSAMNGSMSRLQQLIASQRRFIADASHQLRTPLTVLKTQAELALRACDRQSGTSPGAADVAALRDIVRSIAVTTDSTVLLANRLLTLARIEHGGDSLAMDTVPLRDVAQQVGLEMAMSAVSKNIDLSLEARDEAPVHGQALLLHELVANLVDNALRYTPQGGNVILRVRVMTMNGDGRETVLEVEDSGAGIPPAERERVFTPFYRVGAALESNPGGAGLGLAIVRDIAALHGARLELATAANGHGLKVSVLFSAAT